MNDHQLTHPYLAWHNAEPVLKDIPVMVLEKGVLDALYKAMQFYHQHPELPEPKRRRALTEFQQDVMASRSEEETAVINNLIQRILENSATIEEPPKRSWGLR